MMKTHHGYFDNSGPVKEKSQSSGELLAAQWVDQTGQMLLRLTYSAQGSLNHVTDAVELL